VYIEQLLDKNLEVPGSTPLYCCLWFFLRENVWQLLGKEFI
jgi:hypothetical protein